MMKQENSMSNQVVFSGQPFYAIKKLTELKRRGYKIVRSKAWPDGSTTYVMELAA